MKKQMTGYADLKLNQIFPSEMNYRRNMNKKGLEELTESVKEKGILQPIIVRPSQRQRALRDYRRTQTLSGGYGGRAYNNSGHHRAV